MKMLLLIKQWRANWSSETSVKVSTIKMKNESFFFRFSNRFLFNIFIKIFKKLKLCHNFFQLQWIFFLLCNRLFFLIPLTIIVWIQPIFVYYLINQGDFLINVEIKPSAALWIVFGFHNFLVFCSFFWRLKVFFCATWWEYL
jgi:hypothetical protein